VTAVAGSVVAYEFEPHGTHFNVPLLFRQQLRGTNHRSGDLVQGAYFADSSQLGTSSAFVDELLDTSVDLGTNEATFAIHHFSGYMLASGRGGGGN
jgi:hypothetical protein